MLHPATKLSLFGSSLGTGVVATERIPRGSIVWVQDPLDRLLDPELVGRFPRLLKAAVHNHGYFDREGRIVLCWDHARYINHSCEPNCLSPGYGFELAIRDIEPGEQLTNDYLTLNLVCDFTCACGHPSCRGEIHGADARDLVKKWDAQIAGALPAVAHLSQPLMTLMSSKERRMLQEVLEGREAPRSCGWHLREEPLRIPA